MDAAERFRQWQSYDCGLYIHLTCSADGGATWVRYNRGSGSGTVTTTGTPASGDVAAFSDARIPFPPDPGILKAIRAGADSDWLGWVEP